MSVTRLLATGAAGVASGLACLSAAAVRNPSQPVEAAIWGIVGAMLLLGGLYATYTARERSKREAAEAVLDGPHALSAPSMPELFAAVADRDARREACAMLVWGLACMVIGSQGHSTDTLDFVLSALGVAMAIAGALFLWRASLTAFVAGGILLALVGTWNVAVTFLEWSLGEPPSGAWALWGALGVAQLLWSSADFRRGDDWRAALGMNAAASSRETKLYLRCLLAASPESPRVVWLSQRRLWLWPFYGRARAYVRSRAVLAVGASGFACFAMSSDEAERALSGGTAWDSAGIERRLSVRPDQAEKLRAMMAREDSTPSHGVRVGA